MFSEGDAGDVKNVALEPLFVIPDQTHTRRSPKLPNDHQKVENSPSISSEADFRF